MLSIRMKRLGRKGHPTYRVVVQDSRQSPTSGKFVAQLGSYDPHTKQLNLVKEKAEFYLKNGAQPSDRVISLFKAEKIDLPAWIKQPVEKKKSLRNPDKLRKNRPAEPAEDKQPDSEETDQSVSEENTEEVAASNEAEKTPIEETKAEENTEAEASPESTEEDKS